MNKIEQIHYSSISKEYLNSFYEGKLTEMDCEKVASKSAEITGQIAVEFVRWYENRDKSIDENMLTWEDFYKEFLKTKQ